MQKQSEAFELLDRDEVEGVLSGAFYQPPPGAAGEAPPDPAAEAKPRAKILSRPDHYKVICISLYTEDLARLDEMVKALKRRGLTKANRSALIRQALLQLDLDKVPRGL